MTARIEKILEYKDEAFKNLDVGVFCILPQTTLRLMNRCSESWSFRRPSSKKTYSRQNYSAHITRQIEQLEEQRDLTQLIVHVDMDAFFAVSELSSAMMTLANCRHRMLNYWTIRLSPEKLLPWCENLLWPVLGSNVFLSGWERCLDNRFIWG